MKSGLSKNQESVFSKLTDKQMALQKRLKKAEEKKDAQEISKITFDLKTIERSFDSIVGPPINLV